MDWPQIPQSPTNYKQPPTPDHPPPSSGQAERIIHERIRPLSQEYKRRSALMQMIDMGTSPLKQSTNVNGSSNSSNYYEYDYVQAPTVVMALSSPTTIYATIDTINVSGHPLHTSGSGSICSSVSFSDQSVSNDNTKDNLHYTSKPAQSINKDFCLQNSYNNGHVNGGPDANPDANANHATAADNDDHDNGDDDCLDGIYSTLHRLSSCSVIKQERRVDKIPDKSPSITNQRPPLQIPNARPLSTEQMPVYATIHKKRSFISATTTAGTATNLSSDQQHPLSQKPRPPIPAKPIVPEKRLSKTIATSRLSASFIDSETAKEDNKSEPINSRKVSWAPDQNLKETRASGGFIDWSPEMEEDEDIVILSGISLDFDHDFILGGNKDQFGENNEGDKDEEVGTRLIEEKSQDRLDAVKEHQQITEKEEKSNKVAVKERKELKLKIDEQVKNGNNANSNSILSPFNAEEARKKISEIIESFGNSILDANLSPSAINDIDLEAEANENGKLSVEKYLSKYDLQHLQATLCEHGYDNCKFLVIEKFINLIHSVII